VPVILQKENMLRKSNIPEKIHNEKTIEKNNDDSGKSKTIFNSPKKQNENGKKPMNTNLELLKVIIRARIFMHRKVPIYAHIYAPKKAKICTKYAKKFQNMHIYAQK
jgi:hypothetical protein